MPNAPPSSALVSDKAETVPAFSAGTEVIIISVVRVITGVKPVKIAAK